MCADIPRHLGKGAHKGTGFTRLAARSATTPPPLHPPLSVLAASSTGTVPPVHHSCAPGFEPARSAGENSLSPLAAKRAERVRHICRLRQQITAPIEPREMALSLRPPIASGENSLSPHAAKRAKRVRHIRRWRRQMMSPIDRAFRRRTTTGTCASRTHAAPSPGLVSCLRGGHP
jgi:hypothetical protein